MYILVADNLDRYRKIQTLLIPGVEISGTRVWLGGETGDGPLMEDIRSEQAATAVFLASVDWMAGLGRTLQQSPS